MEDARTRLMIMAIPSQENIVRATGVEFGLIVDAISEAAADFVYLLRSLDEDAGRLPVPHLTWTVAETAAHMLAVIRRGLGDQRRAESLEGLAQLNEQTKDEIPERNPRTLANLIEADVARYIDRLRTAAPERISNSISKLHAGLEADLPTGLSYQLCDVLVHGWDIAVSTERPWNIDPRHAALDMRLCLPALGPWVKEDIRHGEPRTTVLTLGESSFTLEIVTGGGRYFVRSSSEPSERVDPVELLLAVSGRKQSTTPIISNLAALYRPL